MYNSITPGFGVPFLETVPIPASAINVHPESNGEIAGIDTQAPVVKPSRLPNVGVTNYVEHPQANYSLFETTLSYQLVVLYLDSDIAVEPALLFSGSNKFIDFSATALGWKIEQSTVNANPVNLYVLGKLDFNLVDGSIDNDSDCNEFNTFYSGTVFCGGFRNGISFLDDQDNGAPVYRIINGRQTVTGLLVRDSGGTAINNSYLFEKYARVAQMVEFIKLHAPDTQFESGALTESIPASQLLLLDN